MKALTFDDIQLVPSYSEVMSRTECNLTTRLTRNISIGLPIVAAPMDSVCDGNLAGKLATMGGVGFIHRFYSIEEQVHEVRIAASTLGDYCCWGGDYNKIGTVAAAIGVKGDYIERAQELVNAGTRVLLIDVAHGHHILVRTAIERLKTEVSGEFDIIAGNVATEQGAADLEEWGADAVRVGIGGGSVCTTRINTGMGVPQITSIQAALAGVKEIPVMADGGIRHPGDFAKALAVGAETVMIGSMLAGCVEAPGDRIRMADGTTMKAYRGSASFESKVARKEKGSFVEGVATVIPVTGTLFDIVQNIEDGIASAMSYVGALTIEEFYQRADYVEITSSGVVEATPHALTHRA